MSFPESQNRAQVLRQPVPANAKKSTVVREYLERLEEQLPKVQRAFRQVRRELSDVGLLHGDAYLGKIQVCISNLPSTTTAGFVFDEGVNRTDAKYGYRPGTIYLPLNLPHRPYRPGYTIADTLRHEFAHAWHWLEPGFFRRRWFKAAFGAAYVNTNPKPLEMWRRRRLQSPQAISFWPSNGETPPPTVRRQMLSDFATEYATIMASEDFAETFMFYLKYRNSLSRFCSRPGFYRKLRAVDRAVKKARRELGF